MTPGRVFLTKGVGKHKEKAMSFELALRDAGIAQYNLVEVTSIFPPGCSIISQEEGIECLPPGEVVFCVLSRNGTDEPHPLIAASIGLAIPKDKDKYGYFLEHQSFQQETEDAGKYAESLAAEMLATTPTEKSTCDGIDKTMHITQTATSEGHGLWTTVICAAVFVPEDR